MADRFEGLPIPPLPAPPAGRREVLDAIVKADDDDVEPAGKIKVSEAEIKAAISAPLGASFKVALAQGLRDGGEQMADALRVGFREEDPEVRDFLKTHVTKLEEVLDEATAKLVKDAIDAGYSNAESEKKLIDRLLDLGAFGKARAQRIARTESHVSVMRGAHEAMKQAGVDTKIWLSATDDRTRQTHADASGQRRKIDEPFDVGDAKLMYPSDPDSDHPEETVNCFLPGTVIQGSVLLAMRMSYAGPVVKITTRSGNRLSVTPNHPVCTSRGVLAAKNLRPGDYLIEYRSLVKDRVSVDCADDQNRPAKIEQLFDSFARNGTLRRRVDRAKNCDFDGDAEFGNGDIEIAAPERELLDRVESSFAKKGAQFRFVRSDLAEGSSADGSDSRTATALAPVIPYRLGEWSKVDSRVAKQLRHSFAGEIEFLREAIQRRPGLIARGDLRDVLLRGEMASISQKNLRGPIAKRYSSRDEFSSDDAASRSDVASEIGDRCAGEIAFDEIVDVLERDFCGHVFDLQSTTGAIIANNLLQTQCRCTTLTEFSDSETTVDEIVEALDVEGDDDAVEAVEDAAGDLAPEEVARIDPEDVEGLAALDGEGADALYDPSESTVVVGPEAAKDDLKDAVREHLVNSLLTEADARAFENQVELGDLPPVDRPTEETRAVAAISRAVNGDRFGLEDLVGRDLTDVEWQQYRTIAQQFWIAPATRGTVPEPRERTGAKKAESGNAVAKDADFESKHPRNADGTFGDGEGNASSRTSRVEDHGAALEREEKKFEDEREKRAEQNQYVRWTDDDLETAHQNLSKKIRRLTLDDDGHPRDMTETERGEVERAKERVARIVEEKKARREWYRIQREKLAVEESKRTGKLTVFETELGEILGNEGDAYRDNGWKGEYNQDAMTTSDLTGAKIRRYVKLPDGRRAHPDELTEARQRGRIIVVGPDQARFAPVRDWTKPPTKPTAKGLSGGDDPDLEEIQKAFDPSQERDERGRWTSGDSGASESAGVSASPIPEQRVAASEQTIGKFVLLSAGLATDEQKAEIDRIVGEQRDAHGLGKNVKVDPGVPKEIEYGIHAGLAALPPGVHNLLDKWGTTIRISAKDGDEFTVGGATFNKAGHADYTNNEIVMFAGPKLMGNYDFGSVEGRARAADDASEVAAHEAGHIVVDGLLGHVAVAQAEFDALSERVRSDPSIKNDGPEREAVIEHKEELRSTVEAFHNFKNAVDEEGCPTSYSESYRKDTTKSKWLDVKSVNQTFTIPNYQKPEEKPFEFKPAEAIRRYQNEAFAEIVGNVVHRGKDWAKQTTKDKPKTMKAFKALWNIASKKSAKWPKREDMSAGGFYP